MPYIENLIMQSRMLEQQGVTYASSSLGDLGGLAYSSFYPEWEVNTPQHPYPSPYSLAQMGYRTNELVYTCINVRADSIGEASLMVLDDVGETQEEIKDHEIRMLLENPCPGLSEQTFWKVVETYLGIAGFSAWEKQRNNFGDVVGLWPMRPDWCSFLRGQQQPLRAIRYQPYGLPPLDIPVEDLLIFQYFDPLYPLLKTFSPTMSALEMIDTDNNMTTMINNYIKNGAFLGGILTSENQVLQEAEARVYRDRWRQSHGGAKNAGEIAVLGKGLKFQTTANTFREMVFPEVDARSEARICMTFRVPPMLIGAKIGMDRSTFTNYPEARKGFYEGPMTSEWNFLASTVKDQLLYEFEGDSHSYVCNFDKRNVSALKEERNAQVDRADKMYRGKWATKNEARAEAGLDPVEEGDDFSTESASPFGVNTEEDKDKKKDEPQEKEDEKTQEQADLEDGEEKNYKAFANRRIKEGKIDDIPLYEFKYIPEARQRELINRFMNKALILSLRQVVE